MPVVLGGFFVYGDNLNPNIALSLSRSTLVSFANIFMAVHLIMAFFIVVNPVCQEMEEIFKVPHGKFHVKTIHNSLLLIFTV